jgi:hypothetical protein
MRVCETCNIEKDETDFYGGRKHCKKCNRAKYNEKVKNNHYQSIGLKVCNLCNLEKETTEFRVHKSYCKKCENKKTYDSRKDTQYLKNKEYLKIYHKENKDKINERLRSYKKNRKETDVIYKCSIILSQIVNNSLRLSGYEKESASKDIIGLSKFDFRSYIESKFESWMSWENYGLYNGELNYGWDIDHIIPLSSAKSEGEVIKLNHYTNLQPLCSYTNRYIKSDKIQQR